MAMANLQAASIHMTDRQHNFSRIDKSTQCHSLMCIQAQGWTAGGGGGVQGNDLNM